LILFLIAIFGLAGCCHVRSGQRARDRADHQLVVKARVSPARPKLTIRQQPRQTKIAIRNRINAGWATAQAERLEASHRQLL